MYVGQDFDPMQPGETDRFSIEFTDDLKTGQTLSTAVWTCTLLTTLAGSTPDPSPQDRLLGAASFITATLYGTTRTVTTQMIQNMIDGNKYLLQATVTTSDGRTLQRYSHVVCRGAV